MNIVANNIASKLFVAFVAVAMLFMLVSPAKAATTDELQTMINNLLAQVATLQAQLGQGGATAPAAAGVCPFTWTRSLKTRATGADVMKLQQFLNESADTQVSASGVGSKGMESQYFGKATAAAVSKFQVKNAVVAVGTGYFGPMTMAKANALCVVAPATTGTGTGTGTGSTSPTMPVANLTGEASLSTFNVSSGDNTDLREGQVNQSVADMKIKFTDGDAQITRMDIKVTGDASNTSESRPWKAFQNASLWVGGEKVATIDASNKDNYLDTGTNWGTLRFSGLSLLAKKDQQMTVSVAFTVNSVVDGANNKSDWTVGAESVRFVDATDVTSTDSTTGNLGHGNTPTTVSYSIAKAGGTDELQVRVSTNNPAASTLQLKDNMRSDWLTPFIFTMDTKSSPDNIMLNHVPVVVTMASTSASLGSVYSSIVSDAKLVIGGSSYTNYTVTYSTSTGSSIATYDFDLTNDNVVIKAGQKTDAQLQLRFNQLVAGNEGVTLTGSSNSANYDVEGADTLTGGQITGSATGQVQTLRTKGIVGTPGTMSSVLTTAAISGGHDYVTYTVKLDVNAFNQDVYVAKAAGTSLVTNMIDGSGVATTSTGSTVDSFTSTADLSAGGNYFYVPEGSTKTFTIVVKWAPVGAHAAEGVQLTSIAYADTETTPSQTWTAQPIKDYQTNTVSTNN